MRSWIELKKSSLTIPISILLILTAAGILLRFYALGVQSVWFDEATSAITSKSLLDTGGPTLPSGVNVTRAVLNHALIAISFGAFGFNAAAGRIPSATLGTLSIPMAYLLGRKIKNYRVGLILAFFVTFATVQIAWSRQIRMYQQLQFFFLLSLYLLERLLDEMSWRNFFPALIAILCMTVSHDAFGYLLTVPIVAWFLAEKFGWLNEKIRRVGKSSKLDLAGLGILLAAFGVIIALRGLPTSYLDRALSHHVNYWTDYLSYFEGELGGLAYLAVPGALLGIIGRRRNLLYVLSFIFPLYIVSNQVLAFQHRYVFMLIPLIFAFAALTLDHIYEWLKAEAKKSKLKGLKERNSVIVAILVATIGLISVGANFTFTPQSHYELGPTAPQGEFDAAYGYIENHWQEDDVVISTLTSVSWYYLEESDYWISFSHWGLEETPEKDYYTGAEVIENLAELQKVRGEEHGWVIIEHMGNSEIEPEILNYIDNNLDLVEEVSGWNRGVWVYRWK